ncbi:TrkA family potassium uptake protein [Mycoplasma sp. M5725]|uniref:TrkA family potassium uptake protein n=1 Tax=Mycoplasma phocimorsus TaxID=3045839 RepID=A0AAJ1PRA5_9MOLU|nr:TrkA family potassium uptake protein [Mycoplasma phocimorsus]MDJ1645887.1 TrkA family potassium uptake protein [Mycoplasma phocimorsus]
MKLKQNICVIGAGRYGQAVITQLNKLNQNIVAIDNDEKRLQAVSELVDTLYVMDAADMRALNSIGIKNYETVIVCMPNNLEVVAALLELQVENIIARATSKRHARVLKQIGVDLIVRPEYESGIRTAIIATNKNFINYSKNLQEIGSGYVIGTTKVNNSRFENKKLRYLNFYEVGINVIVVKDDNSTFLPTGNTILKKNDAITFVGHVDKVSKFIALMNEENDKKEVDYEEYKK